jgi:hypothetical protein
MPVKIDFLIATMSAFEKTLEKLDQKTKAGHVPVQLAENFNKLLDEIKTESPDAAPELPLPITLDGTFEGIGVTDISYVALEVMVRQVLGVLGVLKTGQ